jgi:Flp pilus assembly protein TadD
MHQAGSALEPLLSNLSLKVRSLKLRMNIFCLQSVALVLVLLVAGCAPVERAPQNVTDETRLRLAKALLASGDPVSAAEAMRTPASRANSQAPDDMMNAQLLIAVGKVDAGLEVAKAALAVRGDDPSFGLEVAGLAVRSNRLPEAEKIYRTILQLHPANVEAMNGEAVVLAQEGNLADAATLLRQALVQRPEDVPARSNLALVVLLSGQREAATPLPQQVGQSNPHPQVRPMPAEAPDSLDRIGVVASRTLDLRPVGHLTDSGSTPDVTPTVVQVAAPVAPPPPIDAKPSPAAQIVPAADHVPRPRPEPAVAWSCPNICQLMHTVFGHKADGQADE